MRVTPYDATDLAHHPVSPPTRRRLVVGISGAPGMAYGVQALRLAGAAGIETHLVVTAAAQQTRDFETDLSVRDLRDMADVVYKPGDVGATFRVLRP